MQTLNIKKIYGSGPEIKCVFFQKAQSLLHLLKLLEVLGIETSTSLGSLQKFEGATGEFKGALGSCLQLISSPDRYIYMNFSRGSLEQHSSRSPWAGFKYNLATDNWNIGAVWA